MGIKYTSRKRDFDLSLVAVGWWPARAPDLIPTYTFMIEHVCRKKRINYIRSRLDLSYGVFETIGESFLYNDFVDAFHFNNGNPYCLLEIFREK